MNYILFYNLLELFFLVTIGGREGEFLLNSFVLSK